MAELGANEGQPTAAERQPTHTGQQRTRILACFF